MFYVSESVFKFDSLTYFNHFSNLFAISFKIIINCLSIKMWYLVVREKFFIRTIIIRIIMRIRIIRTIKDMLLKGIVLNVDWESVFILITKNTDSLILCFFYFANIANIDKKLYVFKSTFSCKIFVNFVEWLFGGFKCIKLNTI